MSRAGFEPRTFGAIKLELERTPKPTQPPRLGLEQFTSLLLYVHLRGIWIFPPPFSQIAHSSSHSPLPVLSIFVCMGAIRHNGAV